MSLVSLIFILFVWMPFCSLCAFAAVWKRIVSSHRVWSGEYYGTCVRFELMCTCPWSGGRYMCLFWIYAYVRVVRRSESGRDRKMEEKADHSLDISLLLFAWRIGRTRCFMSAVNVKTEKKWRQRFEEKDSRGKSIRESRHVCTCKNKLHSVHAEKCHLYRHLAEHRWPDSDFESLIFILFVWMPFCSLCAFAAVWKRIVSFHRVWSE